MKNKKLLYLLLPLTAMVWGLVIYKVMQSLEIPEEKMADNSAKISSVENNSPKPDTFNLLLNYRDPFLANRPPAKRNAEASFIINKATPSLTSFIKPTENASTNSTANSSTTILWPSIEYQGLIENSQNRRKVAMIHINNDIYLLPEGHSASGIKLTKILPDSIQVEFNKQKKFIWKHKM